MKEHHWRRRFTAKASSLADDPGYGFHVARHVFTTFIIFTDVTSDQEGVSKNRHSSLLS